MKIKWSSPGRLCFRVAGFLVAGVMVSMVFLGAVDTHAWFTSQARSNLEVRAASTEDIISEIKLDSGINPEYMILEGSTNLEARSGMIYFELEGEIAEYLLHINPIRIEGGFTYKIALEPNLNLFQHTKLLNPFKNQKIKGTLRVKYLNEFINEPIEIVFTKEYLRGKIMENIHRQSPEVTKLNSDHEARTEITTLMTYLANHLDWQEASSNSKQMVSTQEILMMNRREVEELEGIVLREVSVEAFEFSEDQNKIISIIAPTLQGYIKNLYSTVVELVAELNEKILIIVGLEKRVEGLEVEKANLYMELVEAKADIQRINDENSRLIRELEALLEEVNAVPETILPEGPDNQGGAVPEEEGQEDEEQEKSDQENKEEDPSTGIDESDHEKSKISDEDLM
ncbi:hypothetical protein [Alkaliphilus transvaalensis]|uniref:hypothetical protein n=1 Tax=Alkaliphilus transvaalensis TaxID=114628 RepID=UPI00047A9A30|nr:hypothetical protein [Alkaliphilus transvaalensis]